MWFGYKHIYTATTNETADQWKAHEVKRLLMQYRKTNVYVLENLTLKEVKQILLNVAASQNPICKDVLELG